MMMNTKFLGTAIVLLLTAMLSCEYQNEEELFATPDNTGTQVSFTSDILPIITAKCAIPGCHVTGVQSPDLSNQANIFSRAERIKVRTSAGTMPPSSSPGLTADEINNIAAWVDAGAPNN